MMVMMSYDDFDLMMVLMSPDESDEVLAMMSESLRVYCQPTATILFDVTRYATQYTKLHAHQHQSCIARISRQSAPVTVAWRRGMSHVMTVIMTHETHDAT